MIVFQLGDLSQKSLLLEVLAQWYFVMPFVVTQEMFHQ
jgi:hypothetical protein